MKMKLNQIIVMKKKQNVAFDSYGRKVKVGDVLVYPYRRGSYQVLKHGEVVEVTDDGHVRLKKFIKPVRGARQFVRVNPMFGVRIDETMRKLGNSLV